LSVFREEKDSVVLGFLFLGWTEARLLLATLFLDLGPENGSSAAGNGMKCTRKPAKENFLRVIFLYGRKIPRVSGREKELEEPVRTETPVQTTALIPL